MLAKSVETVLRLSDFYTITAVRWQYTPHIHALYISPNMCCGTYLGLWANNPQIRRYVKTHGQRKEDIENQ